MSLSSAQNSIPRPCESSEENKSTEADSQLSIKASRNNVNNALQLQSTTKGEDEYPHGSRLILTVVSVAISVFLVGLDGTIVSTAIPSIVDDFNALGEIGWFGSVYFLTTALNIIWGKVYKLFPIKAAYLWAILIFELGSLICGVAPNSTALIIGRAIAGVGGAGLQAGGNTIAAFSASAERRPIFIGAIGACYTVSSALGPIIGGALTSNASWRWCFYVNLPIGGLAFFAVLLGFRTPAKAVPPKIPLKEKLLSINPISYAFICASLVCYLLAMQYAGQTMPWHSSTVIGLLVGFVAFLVMGIVWDQKCGERALIQARLFRIRAIAAACPFVFFLTGNYSIMLYFIPLYFQSVTGISAQESGIRTFALVVPLSICFVASGLFLSKVGYYKTLLVLGSAIAATAAGLIYSWSVDTSLGLWLGSQIVLGIGIGLSGQGSIVAAQASVEPADLAPATASVLFFQTISGAFFISAADCAFANQLAIYLKKYSQDIDASLLYSAGGGTNLAAHFSGSTLDSVLRAYMQGLRTAFALAITCACLAFLLSFAAEWKKVNLQAQSAATHPSGGSADRKEDNGEKMRGQRASRRDGS